MLVLVVVLVLFVASVAGISPCALELEQAVFKPKFCGADYFKSLTRKLNPQLERWDSDHFYPNIAQLCLQFSYENDVQLSLLNSQGIDMCVLNNPTANFMNLITKSLNLRSSMNRQTVYLNYYNVTVNGPAIPDASSSDLDSIGMYYVSYWIASEGYVTNATSSIEFSEQVLDYIRTFPVAGPQNSLDLENIGLFGLYLASVTAAQFDNFADVVVEEIVGITFDYPTDFSFSLQTSFLLWLLIYYSTIHDTVELPLNSRLENYKKVQNSMLRTQGIASIVKSFAQPLPITTMSDGLCQYGYNLLLPYGKMTRVVLGQEDLLFKK